MVAGTAGMVVAEKEMAATVGTAVVDMVVMAGWGTEGWWPLRPRGRRVREMRGIVR